LPVHLEPERTPPITILASSVLVLGVEDWGRRLVQVESA